MSPGPSGRTRSSPRSGPWRHSCPSTPTPSSGPITSWRERGTSIPSPARAASPPGTRTPTPPAGRSSGRRPGSFWRNSGIWASARRCFGLFWKKRPPAGPPPGETRREQYDQDCGRREALRRLRRPGRGEPQRPGGQRVRPGGPQRKRQDHVNQVNQRAFGAHGRRNPD